jgi:hypothetical protein
MAWHEFRNSAAWQLQPPEAQASLMQSINSTAAPHVHRPVKRHLHWSATMLSASGSDVLAAAVWLVASDVATGFPTGETL